MEIQGTGAATEASIYFCWYNRHTSDGILAPGASEAALRKCSEVWKTDRLITQGETYIQERHCEINIPLVGVALGKLGIVSFAPDPCVKRSRKKEEKLYPRTSMVNPDRFVQKDHLQAEVIHP
jgi:hypothetical protein